MANSNALKGVVERYIAPPRDEGYAILSIKLPGGTSAKICGKGLGNLAAGQRIEVTGRWTTHQRFGKQFNVIDIKSEVPTQGVGLQKWLMQLGIPGVGEATALKLVKAFGEKTINSIVSGDAKAVEILGKNFDEAQKQMVLHKNEADLGPVLAEHEIGPATRKKIFEKYGEKTARLIQDDPYRLVSDIEGVAFATADKIANATGLDKFAPERITAALIDVLRTSANDGHTAVIHDDLIKQAEKRLGVPQSYLLGFIEDIDSDQMIPTTIIRNDVAFQGWALRSLSYAEELLCEKIVAKLETPSLIYVDEAEKYVARAEASLKIKLNAEQRKAAVMALTNSLSIVLGGPGTGKTTVLKVIRKAWKYAARDGWVKPEISMAAPTGKAAMRMKDVTKGEATTLHRLLKVNGDDGEFRKDESNPIEAGLIAIDETSMKDIYLAASLSCAWGDAQVLLIGDPDQLSSVGPGRVLADMIESGVIPNTELIEVRRQEKGSAIAEGAKAIREGRMPEMGPESDLVFIENDNNEEVADIISQLYHAYVEDGADIQVLTPGHKSEVGTESLNQRLQAEMALEGDVIQICGGIAREGDKVIQIINDRDLNVYNGDAGRVESIDQKNNKALINFDDKSVEMEGLSLKSLSLAYALTIHKSQGSEYDVVIIPMTKSHYMMLRRDLFYTGLTRAKKKCIIVGSKGALERAIRNNDGKMRVTTLCQRLRIAAAAF